MQDEQQPSGLLGNEDIDAAIQGMTFTMIPDTHVTICTLTLRNGFHVTGECSPVSPLGFNVHAARTIAYSNAREKVWLLEGYLHAYLHAERASEAAPRANPEGTENGDSCPD
ncbi:Gp49 family protein [Bordetella flabilis]|uniref:Gp49 family protein n=1 Tax=Bordetella flabilis TaxID=463014 RepID=UPI000A07B03D|nr:Gp49 family protein [Bordetella flabilis]